MFPLWYPPTRRILGLKYGFKARNTQNTPRKQVITHSPEAGKYVIPTLGEFELLSTSAGKMGLTQPLPSLMVTVRRAEQSSSDQGKPHHLTRSQSESFG